jgi:prepilin-type N-terminal cleavage/methylation domain-containing protein
MRPGRAGFTLLEVMCAVAIMATALVALESSISGSVLSASTSVNRRAAREGCRAKLEEILVGTTPADGGGELEDRPGFKWTARTDELKVGFGETQSEVARVVTVEMTFPTDSVSPRGEGASTAGDSETETVKLSSVLVEPPTPAQPANGAPR